MRFIADLHIHSHFSRATSRDLIPELLAFWAQKKGITVIGTGDFTHPGWVAELREKLLEAENGLYRLKPELEKEVSESIPISCRAAPRFLLSGEISCIYKRKGKTRKVHNLILMPDFDSVQRLNERLEQVGNIRSDGRPILGLDSRDLLEIVLEASERAFFIPAHIWTPWFSVFGSKSGFDSLEECFGDLVSHIHALETGLSSDPPMNRTLSSLDDYLLVSNSDAHSPSRLGREANIFDTPLDYDLMLGAMITKKGFEGTVEFFPQEGKYHFDGHRKCQVRLHPRQTAESGGVCPVCGKPLTIGVLHRTFELSDRESPKLSKPFYSLIPLPEVLSEVLGTGPSSKKVSSLYEELLSDLGPELHILMDAPLDKIREAGGPLLSEAISRMRETRVIKEEGYDGEYGTIRLFDPQEKKRLLGQFSLFGTTKEKIPQRQEPPSFAKRKKKKEMTANEQDLYPRSDPILGVLNEAQRAAVLHQGSHVLIVAGPGTGKTMTLSHRIAYQIMSGAIAPQKVLALTFTNKAAREMTERLEALLPEKTSREIWIGTFHGFCLDVLRNASESLGIPNDFGLCSEPDSLLLIKNVLRESGKSTANIRTFLRALSTCKKTMVLSEKRAEYPEELLELVSKYQQKVRSLGMLDFDDLEIETLRLFRERPDICLEYAERFPKIFVDEYQDTSPLQAAILKSLVYGACSFQGKGLAPGIKTKPEGLGHRSFEAELCAIGDPDQAIYGFRGADVKNFYRFAEDFPGAEKISLSENYRSTQCILDSACSVLGKTGILKAHMGSGVPVGISSCATQSEEAEFVVEQIEKLIGGTTYFSLDSGRVASYEEGQNISFGDIAVLFRLNAQGDALEEALSRAGIPFVRSGEKPLIARYPVDILWRFFQAYLHPEGGHYLEAYLELVAGKGYDGKKILKEFSAQGPLEDLINRAISLHSLEGLSDESEELLRRFKRVAEEFEGDLSCFVDMLSLERGIDHVAFFGDRVALMTIHAAKGLEWPAVFITGCEDGLLPCSLFGDYDEAEEKRLFYVGITRARTTVFLSHASRRKIDGRILEMNPSPFLSLIPHNFLLPVKRSKWKPRKKSHRQLDLF